LDRFCRALCSSDASCAVRIEVFNNSEEVGRDAKSAEYLEQAGVIYATEGVFEVQVQDVQVAVL
jgi:hypothetical protein